MRIRSVIMVVIVVLRMAGGRCARQVREESAGGRTLGQGNGKAPRRRVQPAVLGGTHSKAGNEGSHNICTMPIRGTQRMKYRA
jgi:hypothetical protein